MSVAIYLDTNILIAAFETADEVSRSASAVLERVWQGEWRGVTSELTLAELLPKPISKGQHDLGAASKSLLSPEDSAFDVEPVTRRILVAAATLRAAYPFVKLPDTIHVTTALERGCRIFLSGDKRLPSLPTLNIIKLGPHCMDDIRQFAP